jgi:hypothetical protein
MALPFPQPIRVGILYLSFTFALLAGAASAPCCAADAFYSSLQPVFTPPAAPATLLVQSPAAWNVPAGAVLRVHLLGGAADPAAVATNPGQYRFLWQLSAGYASQSGRAVFSGSGFGLMSVRLTGVAASARPHVEKPGSLLVFPYYASSLYYRVRLKLMAAQPPGKVWLN